jgi:hypothetical protein
MSVAGQHPSVVALLNGVQSVQIPYGISASDLSSVCAALALSRDVRELSVHCEGDAQQLASAVKSSRSLRSLALQREPTEALLSSGVASLTVHGAALQPSLVSCLQRTALTRLCLSFVSLPSSEAAMALARTLPLLSALLRLELVKLTLHDSAHFADIVRGARDAPALTAISLSCTHLSLGEADVFSLLGNGRLVDASLGILVSYSRCTCTDGMKDENCSSGLHLLEQRSLSFSSLKRLSFCNTVFAEGLELKSKLLPLCTNLEEFVGQVHGVSNVDCQLSALQCLRVLDLSRSFGLDLVFCSIMSAVAKLTAVRELVLDGCLSSPNDSHQRHLIAVIDAVALSRLSVHGFSFRPCNPLLEAINRRGTIRSIAFDTHNIPSADLRTFFLENASGFRFMSISGTLELNNEGKGEKEEVSLFFFFLALSFFQCLMQCLQ